MQQEITHREYKERRVYQFDCAQCGKKRRMSFWKRIANKKTCRTCRRSTLVDENQLSMFPAPE